MLVLLALANPQPNRLQVMLEAVADHVQRTREGEGGSNTEYEEAEE